MLTQTSQQSQQIVSTLENSTKHTNQQNIQQQSLQQDLSVPQNSNVLLAETNLNKKLEDNVLTVTKESILKNRRYFYQNKKIKKLKLPLRTQTLKKQLFKNKKINELENEKQKIKEKWEKEKGKEKLGEGLLEDVEINFDEEELEEGILEDDKGEKIKGKRKMEVEEEEEEEEEWDDDDDWDLTNLDYLDCCDEEDEEEEAKEDLRVKELVENEICKNPDNSLEWEELLNNFKKLEINLKKEKEKLNFNLTNQKSRFYREGN
uniref:Uncharacterized protein n=1 Tax=Meloidogyne enterolobii TaxID=390850 RepID=A0A6V7U7Y5_MELEN|nr:unnamed protein product [Meloidogyne enterolobii]